MIAIAPVTPQGSGPWHERLMVALRHPAKWITDLSGGGPIYALAILFGFNMVEEMDRDCVRAVDPEHPRRRST